MGEALTGLDPKLDRQCGRKPSIPESHSEQREEPLILAGEARVAQRRTAFMRTYLYEFKRELGI